MRQFKISIFSLILLVFLGGCEKNNGTGWTPDNLPDDPKNETNDSLGIHIYHAPLYWSVYEYCRVAEQAGGSIDMSEGEWDRVIDWVATNLKPYGYDMICTDGFMSMLATDESGYMTQYGSMNLKKLIAKCNARGLKLGIYDNPLWIHGSDNITVEGTNVTFGDLRYNETDRTTVMYPNSNDTFPWLVPSHRGAKEYIDGFFKHYKNMGVSFIRMDFLCLFESASGAGGMPGKGYGRKNYELALQYICEAASKYKVFTSLVMPNLFNDAELEKKYGNMVRTEADTFDGGWDHVSGRLRWQVFDGWPTCHNQFDGLIHWSHIAGRGKVIMDGDFIRLNTLSNDNEKAFSVSLQLLAGGPVAVADQYNTIVNGDLKFYQNEEMLALNKDGFVGKPLSENLNDSKSQIWYGQMSNGDWIIGLFNREDNSQYRSVKFSTLGITGKMKMHDLWNHTDEGEADNISVTLESHSCKIVKLTNP
ncbi:MAG: glucan 1,6-alpha-isomaltosidase [Paludibacter sp.]|nr:glucan 1,6-alpha-isomaltosidase [Paludibacter sp.]